MIEKQVLTLSEAMTINRVSKDISEVRSLRIMSNYSFSQFSVFLRAYFASGGISLDVRENPFGTLMTELLVEDDDEVPALIIIDTDLLLIGRSFRSNTTRRTVKEDPVEEQVSMVISAVETFVNFHSNSVYLWLVDVRDRLFQEYPPYLYTQEDRLWNSIERRIFDLTAKRDNVHLLRVLPLYIDRLRLFQTGEVIFSTAASRAAKEIASTITTLQASDSGGENSKKLLITDADNTLWHGVVGDDGVDGIFFDESKEGSLHFLYQRFLDLLSHEGVLLAILSKNSKGVVENVFALRDLYVGRERFAIVEESWGAKSDGIKNICNSLNLLATSVLFIDDSTTEIAEVQASLPAIDVERFPDSLSELPAFLDRVRQRFVRGKPALDVEKRLNSYRAVVKLRSSKEEKSGDGQGYLDYLRRLNMVLSVSRTTASTRNRVFELINKTNQFNLNGVRYSERDFDEIFVNGYILEFSLKDDQGDFGIIGVIMLRPSDRCVIAESIVLSCRVFSRGIEDAMINTIESFLSNVGSKGVEVLLRFKATEKNEPLRLFLRRIGGYGSDKIHEEGSPLLLPLERPRLASFLGRVVAHW